MPNNIPKRVPRSLSSALLSSLSSPRCALALLSKLLYFWMSHGAISNFRPRVPFRCKTGSWRRLLFCSGGHYLAGARHRFCITARRSSRNIHAPRPSGHVTPGSASRDSMTALSEGRCEGPGDNFTDNGCARIFMDLGPRNTRLEE